MLLTEGSQRVGVADASCICVGYCMIRFIVTVCMLQLVYADLAADSRRRVCLKNCVTWLWLWAPQPGMDQDHHG
jgi:hypothetical protein